MAYEIIWEQDGVHRRYVGNTSDIEIMQSQKEVGSDARLDTLRYIINDLTACDDVSYTKEGTELMSAFGVLSEMANPNLKVAIVTNTRATGSLVAEYISASLNSLPTRVFCTLGEARAWVAAP